MNKNLFLAVGQDGARLTSADGATWSKPEFGKEGQILKAVAFAGGIALAAGSAGGDNLLATTTDGFASKTVTVKAGYVNYIRGLGTFGDRFLALGGDPGSVGNSRTFTMLSKDGLTWTEMKPVGGKHLLRRMASGGGKLVAVGDRGRRAASNDAIEWTDAPEVKAIDTLIDVAFGSGVFVGVGLHGLRMSSADGLKWEHRQTGEEGEHLNSVLWAKDRFVAIGAGATFTSADGTAWEKFANENAPLSATYGDGLFVGVAWKGKILTSADAKVWKQVLKIDRHLEAVGFGAVSGS